jgi:hypothetical protein
VEEVQRARPGHFCHLLKHVCVKEYTGWCGALTNPNPCYCFSWIQVSGVFSDFQFNDSSWQSSLQTACFRIQFFNFQFFSDFLVQEFFWAIEPSKQLALGN